MCARGVLFCADYIEILFDMFDERNLKKKATWVFSPKKLHFCLKNFRGLDSSKLVQKLRLFLYITQVPNARGFTFRDVIQRAFFSLN